MSNFATFDGNGFPTAFYSEELLGFKEIIVSETPVYGKAVEPTEANPNPERPILGFDYVTGPNPECLIPLEAVELTGEQYREFIDNAGLRRWESGRVVEYMPPKVEPVTVLPAITLWERLTEAEAEQVDAAMSTQPFRTRQIFMTANTFRSDHELWPLLVQMATDLFGEDRAGELLAA